MRVRKSRFVGHGDIGRSRHLGHESQIEVVLKGYFHTNIPLLRGIDSPFSVNLVQSDVHQQVPDGLRVVLEIASHRPAEERAKRRLDNIIRGHPQQFLSHLRGGRGGSACAGAPNVAPE